ncbi:uncharacterized protein LOC118232634 [Anguilla anguilla]|uniref:uncharacterized protein LOC118232634 n=1 Tax=Anguilla anguilla TaxID=7936 RepID=UPI0015AE2C85|nr:uncharacterized protein LOC118232634 [Anguilla anguilla]XP_035283605.1 uncharacterized protein LOC118232634 [Anguilla anguilla]
MASSNQIVKVTKGLTKAAECREDTKLLMQPHANWEEYLTPAPMSIAILAELIFISSNTDFSIRKGGPEGGFKYIKYPDSFRACLMQVCNSGWRAFNDAHKNMDQIRLYTNNVPNYIKLAVKILLQDDDNLVQTMLPDQLDNISNIADECVNLAQSTEKRFTDVIELIQELLETCTSAKQVYGNELEEVRRKISENELRKKAAEEATSRAEQAYKNMSEQLKEAQESFKSAMDSIPSGWEMIGMNFVEGLANSVTTLLSGVASLVSLPASLPGMIAGAVSGNTAATVANNNATVANNDQISTNNIYSKSPQILPLVEGLNVFFDGDQIKLSEIVDQKTKLPKTNWIKEQFEKIQEVIKKEKECKPKMDALGICTKAITICSELGKVKPEEKPDDAITKQIVELMKSLRKDAMVFDTESKSATNTSPFNVKPPQITQTQENSSGSKSAGQIAADNARFKVEQTRAQLNQVRELNEKHYDNMEAKKKELTEILVTLRNCAVKEIDFTTTIKILAQGLEAMGNVKEQWQKLVRFFQMVSNLIKTCLGTSLKDFVKTGEKASNKTFKYTSRMFLKDVIYNQAFHASNIASLVNMIAGTYTDVSNKYLMDAVSKLSKLMSLDVSKPEFLSERENMKTSCDQAEEGIRNLVKKNKQDFERKTMQRLEKIESELMAVLPPVSEEKKKEIQEAVHKASKNDEDDDQY